MKKLVILILCAFNGTAIANPSATEKYEFNMILRECKFLVAGLTKEKGEIKQKLVGFEGEKTYWNCTVGDRDIKCFGGGKEEIQNKKLLELHFIDIIMLDNENWLLKTRNGGDKFYVSWDAGVVSSVTYVIKPYQSGAKVCRGVVSRKSE